MSEEEKGGKETVMSDVVAGKTGEDRGEPKSCFSAGWGERRLHSGCENPTKDGQMAAARS